MLFMNVISYVASNMNDLHIQQKSSADLEQYITSLRGFPKIACSTTIIAGQAATVWGTSSHKEFAISTVTSPTWPPKRWLPTSTSNASSKVSLAGGVGNSKAPMSCQVSHPDVA